MQRRATQLILLLWLFLIPYHACFAEWLSSPKFSKWLEHTMQQYHVPGVSIVLIKHYKIAGCQGFGIANIQNQQPVTCATLFQAGSISKPVTAMAALKAVQDGKLVLNKNVNDYLTSWKVPDNSYTQYEKVTLARLLDHSAGITVHGFIGYAQAEKLPTLLQVLNGMQPANSIPIRVAALPGHQFIYSGGGYTIIQQLLIDVYHRSFTHIMQAVVLQPLGMKNSTFAQPIPANFYDHIAMPYRPDGKLVEGGPHTYIEQAAAGLWTTSTDLAIFTLAIMEAAGGLENKVLNSHFAKLMVYPAINNAMGLGFEIGVNKYAEHASAGAYFMHFGENEGYRNVLIANVKSGNGLVIMTNMSPDSITATQDNPINDWTFIHTVEKYIADAENWQ